MFDEMNDLEMMEEDKLIDAFGDRVGNLLIEYGYNSLSAIAEADDGELLDIAGVGKSTLKSIRERIPFVGVSDRDATTESEVKPDSDEAEPAVDAIADSSAAVEADVAEVSYPPMPSGGVVAIRNLRPSTLKMTAPSGMTYIWSDAGSIVEVLPQDVEFVLGKNRNVGRACCGSSSERIYFEIA